MTKPPILYSFRRCPYAMRARMALAKSCQCVELREVLLKDKPAEMLAVSPKATVPVLVLEEGRILDESLDIMHWSLQRCDPDHWLENYDDAARWVRQCDEQFKPWLDRYKYSDRYPEHHEEVYREQCLQFFQLLDNVLTHQAYILPQGESVADVAIFPFIRQCAMVDYAWFSSLPLAPLQSWLQRYLESELFQFVMKKYAPWKVGDAATYWHYDAGQVVLNG